MSPRLAATPGLKSPAARGMRDAVLVTTAAAVAATTIVALLPQLHTAYRRSALHVALETAASLIALLAAFLMAGRLRRRTLLNELMLASALSVLALSNLLFGTLPTLAGPVPPRLMLWASLAGSMLGALLLALAAFVPPCRLSRSVLVPAGAAAALCVTGATAAVLAGFQAPAPQPPSAIPELLPGTVLRPAAQMLIAVLYGLAAAGFLRRMQQLADEFLGWLAIAAVLAAASRLNYFLFPALAADSGYSGEAFRLCFYAVLLLGSMREIWSYWHALSDAAVLEERRRIARDLHDGLAQELAYLDRNLAVLDGEASADMLQRLQRAVERAQNESRRAIRALASTASHTFAVTLAEAASEVAERFHVELAFDGMADVRLSEVRAEALVRIACEAVTNAARHSGTRLVRLGLVQDGEQVRLRVSDTGCGFDPSLPGSGFGLISMRERACSVGGNLRISSAPGRGSEVEAVL